LRALSFIAVLHAGTFRAGICSENVTQKAFD
jgi:hypothetical protein